MAIHQCNSTTYEVGLNTGDKAEIGDIDSLSFKPHLKLNRWGKECSLTLNLPTDEKPLPVIKGEKIIWLSKGRSVEFYPTEGGFEFDIIIPQKPETNIVSLDFEHNNLEFCYQPPLTEEFKEGWSDECQDFITVSETEVRNSKGAVVVHRPENVVGSYAVYHATRTNMHKGEADAEKYKCGKAFHVYRPKVTDAKGNWIWANINITRDNLTITIDQDWLNNASYPVVIDPEFGYHPATPATANALASCIAMAGAAFIRTAVTGDTITKFSIYGTSNGGTTGFDAAIYSIVGGVPSARLSAGVIVVLPTVAAWADSAAVSQALSNGVTYCVALGNDGAGTENAYYDTGSGNNRSNDTGAGALPASWTHATWSTTRWGVYATYTAGASGWAHKFNGVANANIGKVCGIPKANIAKICGI
jgi:hypothetical protein